MGEIKRALSDEEISAVVQPLGRAISVETLDGGMFASVARVELDDGTAVAVKSAPPPSTTALLSYETSVMDAEIEVLGIGRDHPGMKLPILHLVDRSRQFVDVDVIVTDFLSGRRWDTCGADMTATATASATREVGRVLAAFARVPGTRFGYVTDRMPQYSSRNWFSTFRAMMTGLIEDAARHGVDVEGEAVAAAVDRHRHALEAVAEPRLVHGDLWAGNTFVDEVTGRVTGVIDPERALWADPLFDIAGTDQATLADPPDELLAGMQEAGLDVTLTADAMARITLYRLWFAVAMLAESGPRGHLLEDREGREDWLRTQARGLLALL